MCYTYIVKEKEKHVKSLLIWRVYTYVKL